MNMEETTLRNLEMYLHALHKKIDGIYDLLSMRAERENGSNGKTSLVEPLFDNQDLCLLLQVSPRTLQRYRSIGALHNKRLGQKTYYTEEDVMRFIEENVKDFSKENVEQCLSRIRREFK